MQLDTLNLKEEIEKIISKYNTKVRCANVDIKYYSGGWKDIKNILKVNFLELEYHKFMELVDINIENLSDDNFMHHGQYVKVWFTDGSWIECADTYSRTDEGAQAFYYYRFEIDKNCL